MAASRGYTIFGALMEILGGILLLIPRFRRIGALVCVAVMVNVFALNLSYDVPVKLFSCNLLLLAVFLAVPEFLRLVRLLVFNSAAPPVRSTLLSERRWIDRSARILQSILGVVLFFVFLHGEDRTYSQSKAELAVTVPFQGVWTANEIEISGDSKRGLFSEKTIGPLHLVPGDDRWTRLIFERPNEVIVRSLKGYQLSLKLILENRNTMLQLRESDDPTWTGDLKIQQTAPDMLVLQGEVNGEDVFH